MKLIAIKSGKTDKYDQLRCIRLDGSETGTTMPRQGVLSHDLIHYVVEFALGYEHGFLGLVAKGADIGFAMERTHSVSTQDLADQAIHAEAIVESLQAQIWSGAFDADMFFAGLESACAVRECAAPDLSRIDVSEVLHGGVLAMSERWQRVAYHAALDLDMPGL